MVLLSEKETAAMADRIDIVTIKALRSAIRKAKLILVQPRFGCTERWIKISKAEAIEMIFHISVNDTPADQEMYRGVFGSLEDDTLFLG